MTHEELQDMADEFYKYLDPETKAEMKRKWVAKETKRLQMPLVFPVRSDLTNLIGPEWDWDVSDDMRSDLLGC